ncbi:zinc finger domain-containing protein [Oribacterium sp. P9]
MESKPCPRCGVTFTSISASTRSSAVLSQLMSV